MSRNMIKMSKLRIVLKTYIPSSLPDGMKFVRQLPLNFRKMENVDRSATIKRFGTTDLK